MFNKEEFLKNKNLVPCKITLIKQVIPNFNSNPEDHVIQIEQILDTSLGSYKSLTMNLIKNKNLPFKGDVMVIVSKFDKQYLDFSNVSSKEEYHSQMKKFIESERLVEKFSVYIETIVQEIVG